MGVNSDCDLDKKLYTLTRNISKLTIPYHWTGTHKNPTFQPSVCVLENDFIMYCVYCGQRLFNVEMWSTLSVCLLVSFVSLLNYRQCDQLRTVT